MKGWCTAMIVKQIAERIYLMRDAEGSGAYLIIGDERALLIDTMYGLESVRECVEKITSLPVTLIHSHGHCDHIGGDAEFGEAYIDPKDLGVAKEHWKMVQKENNIHSEIQWKNFNAGETIDLGGYLLETYEVPGHTPGGLCFLSRQDRIFITGDAISDHVWMHLEESTPLEVLIQSLRALDPIRDAFDEVWSAHAIEKRPPSVIDELARTAQEILDGKTQEDFDYSCFRTTYKAHRFYEGDDTKVVVYQPR